jgi:uncharacterized damage-inducible protein DinB
MNSALTEMFKQNRWANLRLLDLVAGQDPAMLDATAPGNYGAVGDTLFHIVRAEEGYLHRLRTGQPKPSGRNDPFPGLPALRQRAERSGDGLIAVAQGFQTGAAYPIDWEDGKVHDVPAEILLVQAFQHSTEHRTQILTILSQQGIAVPELSGWTYFEETMIPC